MNRSVLSPRHTVVLTGAFGSGKTEVAINYARAAHAQGRSVILADCDIVTPYFRVGDQRELLQREGIRVIAAPGGLASFELPAVSPELTGALSDPKAHAVLDVGGDPAGARFLSGYAEIITASGYDMWLVANPFRPATSDPQAVAAQAREIAAQSRLRFTGLVANPNLGPVTQPDELRRGLAEVQQAATQLDLPIVLLAVEQALLAETAALGLSQLPLRLTVRLPWEGGEQETRPQEGN